MPAQFRLQAQQIPDLKAISNCELSTLDAVVNHLSSLSPTPLEPKQLRQEILSQVQGQEPLADPILRQMLSLHSLMSQMKLSIDEVFSGLLDALRAAEPAWNGSEIEAWRQREPLLRRLLSLDAGRIVAKALDLSYEYANLLRTARILTDVRPVFTVDGTTIEGAVVSHKLSIRYDNVDGLKSLMITVDEQDLRGLRTQCDRAMRKSETIVAELGRGLAIRTIVPGKDEDE